MAHLPSLILAIVLPFAAANDPLFYKIPNWLTYRTMIVGVLYDTHLKGLDGFLHHVSGMGTGLAMAVGKIISTLLGMEWSL
jgi:Flp pilus assembly protein protease CpaA